MHVKFHEFPSSPPPKAEAFEDFKAERGSEINRILKENKAVLSERTARLRTLTDVINATKRDLDYITYELRQFREQKQSQGEHYMTYVNLYRFAYSRDV